MLRNPVGGVSLFAARGISQGLWPRRADYIVAAGPLWQRRTIGPALLRKVAEQAMEARAGAAHTEPLKLPGIRWCAGRWGSWHRRLRTTDTCCEAGDFSHCPPALRDGLRAGLRDHL